MNAAAIAERTSELLVRFNLTTAAAELACRLEQAGQHEALRLVLEVLEMEAETREQRKIARLRRASQLPPGKTFDTLDLGALPAALGRKLGELAGGDFLEGGVNLLAFGPPGVGKSHAACALGHALIEGGHAVLFRPAYQLVQELLAAKRDLTLPRLLRRLDGAELLILDDIGYVKQSAEEAEVLFTLIAQRYERRSVMITSNLVFSEWERIFKEPMATAAAIDRLVHHSTILEFNAPSYRTAARRRTGAQAEMAQRQTDRRRDAHEPTIANRAPPLES
jgi:DNA replication protein DnaC